MNIFVLDNDPTIAATMMCDKHIPKMALESAQMMAQALRRHGATDEQMPLTKSGTPYKGGHPHHPCTVWAGDSRANFYWLADHALALCEEYTTRFGKTHACEQPIKQMNDMSYRIRPTDGSIVVVTSGNVRVLTPFALAMPDEFKVDIVGRLWDETDAVKAYRRYYHSKTFAKWEKGTPAPTWWRGVEVTA